MSRELKRMTAQQSVIGGRVVATIVGFDAEDKPIFTTTMTRERPAGFPWWWPRRPEDMDGA